MRKCLALWIGLWTTWAAFAAGTATPAGTAAAAGAAPPHPPKTHRLEVTPATVAYGYYWADAPPVLHIDSGDIIDVDTLLTNTPAGLAKAGVADRGSLWKDASGPPLAELCRALRVGGVAAVEAVAFPVLAKEGGR